MKLYLLTLILLVGAILTGCNQQTQKGDYAAFDKVAALSEVYKPLALTEIKPEGWLKDQISENLDGFTGRLDTLAPGLIMEDKIYGEDRLTKKVKNKDVGALGEEDKQHLKKLQQYVDYILSTQDKDGYLGIYDNDLRYNFDNENGELWAKSSLLRGLLAWYEYTNDQKILAAIEHAVQNVMDNYPVNHSRPFYSRQPNVGGTSHGLTITDVFESLYRITGKEAYRDYCLFLYKDFSEQHLNESAQYNKLINDTLMLSSHGVHVYEHLRSLAAAYYASGNQNLEVAIHKFLTKIEDETTASGAGVGDEWIGGKRADATTRGYEYCSLHELMHSYIELLMKSGNKTFGDKVEKIFFNAAQGARHPNQSCIAYLKSDNSYYMTGGLNGDTLDKNQTRYSYSPVHQEAAVCCVPNAGRIAPYYVQHMWLKSDRALVASLLGPSVVSTDLKNQPVTIVEQTRYPFENTFEFLVSADFEFELKIRKPDWVTTFTIDTEYYEEDGFIVIRKNWEGTQTVKLSFVADVVTREDLNREKYFTYGALVLASPLAGKEEKTKSFPIPGFYNLTYAPENLKVYHYTGDPVVAQPQALRFKTSLYNAESHKKEPVELVPMGETILRQVTFKPKPD